MKDRLRYRLQMLCILCLAVMGLLGSCVAERLGDTGLSGDGEGKQEVRLKLQVPGLSKAGRMMERVPLMKVWNQL